MFGDYKKFYQNIFANSAVLPATATLPERVKLGAYNNRNDRQNIFSQTDLVWENRLAGIDQTLLFGFELGHERSRNLRNTGTLSGDCLLADGSVPLSDPTCDVDAIWAPIVERREQPGHGRRRCHLRAGPDPARGMARDRRGHALRQLQGARGRSPPQSAAAIFAGSDSLWSPRLGLVFKPADNLSIYTSYSRSYLPQSGDQFSSLDQRDGRAEARAVRQL